MVTVYFEAAVTEAQQRYDVLDMFEATRPPDPEDVD